MNSDLRQEYDLARQDLKALEGHLVRLEQCGITSPWTPALRSDVDRFARALLAAVEDAERRVQER
jgi:hypothetical protein